MSTPSISLRVHNNPLEVSDILSNVLLPKLVTPSLIVLSCTSSLFRKLCRPFLLIESAEFDYQGRVIKQLYLTSSLKVLKWFEEFLHYEGIFPILGGLDWNRLVATAARGCNWELIQHFIPKYNPSVTSDSSAEIITAEAAASGSIEMLQYMRSRNVPWDASVYSKAAHYGHIHVIEYALKHNCPEADSADVISEAIQGNQFETVKWLHARKFALGLGATTDAASVNNLAMLQWLHSKGALLFASAARGAARNANVEMLRWLITVGCPLTTSCTGGAAESGSLECLQILRDAGCEWDSYTLTDAARNGHVELLSWALDHGCPHDTLLILTAVRMCQLKVIDCLFARGVEYNPRDLWCAAVESNSLEVLQYLHDEKKARGFDCSYIASFAAYEGVLSVVKWTFENKGRKRIDVEKIYQACEGNPVAQHILQWLEETHPLRISSRASKQKRATDDEEEGKEEELPKKITKRRK